MVTAESSRLSSHSQQSRSPFWINTGFAYPAPTVEEYLPKHSQTWLRHLTVLCMTLPRPLLRQRHPCSNVRANHGDTRTRLRRNIPQGLRGGGTPRPAGYMQAVAAAAPTPRNHLNESHHHTIRSRLKRRYATDFSGICILGRYLHTRAPTSHRKTPAAKTSALTWIPRYGVCMSYDALVFLHVADPSLRPSPQRGNANARQCKAMQCNEMQ